MPSPTHSGISSEIIDTGRIKLNVLRSGTDHKIPVLFIHGNVSSATFWEQAMISLPLGYCAVAPDLRGYGKTEPLPVDATKGLDDMVQDVRSLVETLQIGKHHIVGHSMGGGIVMKYAIAHPQDLYSITLVDTMSPYGYGGSKGINGEPVSEDGAPAGVNPEFIRLLDEKDRSADHQLSPRNVLRTYYFKPGYEPEREEDLLDAMLSTRVGEDWYPGEMVPSENWPGVAPGKRGILPAFNRKYFDASAIVNIEPKPPILWLRGSADQIISDNAMFDLAALGAMGAVPDYPGIDVYPPQPMLQQTRAVLQQYQTNGGDYREVVIEGAGHTPFIEKPFLFNEVFHPFLLQND